jgi:hypothetical protein
LRTLWSLKIQQLRELYSTTASPNPCRNRAP